MMMPRSSGRTQISPTSPIGSGSSSSLTICSSAKPRGRPADAPLPSGSSGVNMVTAKVSVMA
jgi:hypothetical protein